MVVKLTPLDDDGARFSLSIASSIDERAGASDFVVSAEIVGEFNLTRGSRIDEERARSLFARLRELALFDRAVALLATRGLSRRDLGLRLRRLGAFPDEAEHALERLESLGLVDDQSYARHTAASRRAAGHSRARIAQELRRKGVATAVAADAAREATDEDDVDQDEQAADKLAEKRMRSLARLDPAVARRRLTGFLLRRGYPAALVARVVSRAIPR